ncbi:MAG: hypothetical protein FWG50_13165 [Kiritimatiellaeota bacterium]|nr:hypothetical protein [Kiritimatiellota bacterium]
MRNRDVYFALAALAVFGVLSAGQSRRLAGRRRERMPEASAAYSADVPPALTFVMVGLGGFRGVVSEILWYRVSRLQDQGRYLEIVQLADWITRLDPHAAEAWAYNAWNLSYNISVMMNRPEDRLRWVRNGVSLLRDESLRFNPHEPRLYRELAWLYQNKIGDILDTAHLTYKFDLLAAMAPLVNADGTLNAEAPGKGKLAAMCLDAGLMLDVERRFGPVDWRMPETHALYWADQGAAYASGTELMMARRAVYQPLMLSVFRGRFTGSLEKREWDTAPNLALALPAADYMLVALRENRTPNQTRVTLRYLASAVRLLAEAGEEDAARQIYQRMGSVLQPQEMPAYDDVAEGRWEA